jgi:hypothetical protein
MLLPRPLHHHSLLFCIELRGLAPLLPTNGSVVRRGAGGEAAHNLRHFR